MRFNINKAQWDSTRISDHRIGQGMHDLRGNDTRAGAGEKDDELYFKAVQKYRETGFSEQDCGRSRM